MITTIVLWIFCFIISSSPMDGILLRRRFTSAQSNIMPYRMEIVGYQQCNTITFKLFHNSLLFILWFVRDLFSLNGFFSDIPASLSGFSGCFFVRPSICRIQWLHHDLMLDRGKSKMADVTLSSVSLQHGALAAHCSAASLLSAEL